MFILFGVLLSLGHSIAITSPPTAVSCSIARLILAFGPTFMYVGLLTKTMRVMIIFRSKILKPKVKYIKIEGYHLPTPHSPHTPRLNLQIIFGKELLRNGDIVSRRSNN